MPTTMTADQLSLHLNDVGSVMTKASYAKALKQIGIYLASQAKLCFAGAKAPDGTPWLPLMNPSRKRGGASAKPLRDTGVLMASMVGKASANHVERVTDTRLEWGTNVLYAAFHQFGTKRIPPRPFLGFTDDMARKIGLIVLDNAAAMLKGKL